MKFFAVAAVLCLATPTFSQATSETYSLWYDMLYDQTDEFLSCVACSTGEYGLSTRGYSTFGSLPSYPLIGGAPQIQSWDSPNCGTCWQLTYTDPNGETTVVFLTAINTPPRQGGFTISLEGMNRLTNGNALTLDGLSIIASPGLPGARGL